jgi:hypothetical protein
MRQHILIAFALLIAILSACSSERISRPDTTQASCEALNCDDGNACTIDSCSDGQCINQIAPERTSCPGGTCSDGGICESAILTCSNDSECDDDNSCTQDSCTDSECVYTPSAAGEECAEGVCNAEGVCIPEPTCLSDADCEDQNGCTNDACIAGSCVYENMQQGDACKGGAQQCDGNGNCVECLDSVSCFDNNECTIDTCTDGVCEYFANTEGTACGENGLCDASGECITDDSECHYDDECDDSNVCTVNTCTDGVCVTVEAENNSVCAEGMFCIDALCIECLEASDCDDNNSCTQNECLNGTCNYAALPTGTLCDEATGLCDDDAQCQPKTPIGAPCMFNAQCISQQCATNNPVIPLKTCQCNDDAQCSTLCNESTGRCADCLTDSDCEGGQYCTSNNECVSKISVGMPCSKDSACESNVCEAANGPLPLKVCKCSKHSHCDSVCNIATGMCTDCIIHADCDTDQYCSVNNACVNKQPVGTICGSDAHCASDECVSIPAIGLSMCRCTSNSHCPSTPFQSSVCKTSNGSCVECTKDLHCGYNEYCNSSNDCVAKLDVGAVCAGDSSCASDNCVPMAMFPGVSLCKCTNDSHCDGVCKESTGSCFDCLGDNHCAGDEYCSYDKECEFKLPLGAKCSRDGNCLSNNCDQIASGFVNRFCLP